nr:MAG TPA: hypothetical protein [Caudoviricetes sp.]
MINKRCIDKILCFGYNIGKGLSNTSSPKFDSLKCLSLLDMRLIRGRVQMFRLHQKVELVRQS